MPPKAKNRDTLTALKKQASVVNAHFRKEISNKKKECADTARKARQVLLIQVPATSAGSVEKRKAFLKRAINRRLKRSARDDPTVFDRLFRAKQKEKLNSQHQRTLDAELRRLRALKKERNAGAGAGASA
jgi:hypothetical protein